MKVGQIYRLTDATLAELGDERDPSYDEIRIVGEVFMGDDTDSEWCFGPGDGSFGPVFQSSAQAILDKAAFVRDSAPKRRTAFGLELV